MVESVHVYLDEKYAAHTESRKNQVTALTGVYLMATQIVPFRKKYFSLLRDLFPSPRNHIPSLPEVHACELFPDEPDKTKFKFMEGLASIINEMKIPTVRIGYRRNERAEELFHNCRKQSYINFEKEWLIPMCFMGLKASARSDHLFHYFMERDDSPLQYFIFQRNTVSNQWMSEFLSPGDMSIDHSKIGDVFFYAKNLPGGVLPDCLGYLLHLRWREDKKGPLSPFQSRMVEICNSIEKELTVDQIVDLRKMKED